LIVADKKILTKADKDALNELPASGWFDARFVSAINRPIYRCERLEQAGYLTSRVVGAFPFLHREYTRVPDN
jgi:hypothetical protein